MMTAASFRSAGSISAVMALVIPACLSGNVFSQQLIVVSVAQPSDGSTSNKIVSRFLPLPSTRPAPNTAQATLEAPVQPARDVAVNFTKDAAVHPAIEVSVRTPELDARGLENSSGESGVLDVDSMIHRPLSGSQIFSKLKTDRHYFDSAAGAEVTRLQLGDGSPFLWNPSGICWQSPAFCFSPLYFEQPNYERYGQGKGKPFASTVSAARFVGQVTTLPIAVFCTPPWTKSCTLGHHRPGDCAPYQRKSEPH